MKLAYNQKCIFIVAFQSLLREIKVIKFNQISILENLDALLKRESKDFTGPVTDFKSKELTKILKMLPITNSHDMESLELSLSNEETFNTVVVTLFPILFIVT